MWHFLTPKNQKENDFLSSKDSTQFVFFFDSLDFVLKGRFYVKLLRKRSDRFCELSLLSCERDQKGGYLLKKLVWWEFCGSAPKFDALGKYIDENMKGTWQARSLSAGQ